ncbi:hypothetical protein [Brachybacterium kimchii]|uniref:Beta-glucuronidase C-terminal domain-containing protein n=1 Tax=Brachybacterium kimchii TaxID=2942909 RepID=A0ABY4N0J8_9MICO|nr:hypothetical protein [Brachybacterium kimchii]UQN28083.1 hypothetical protein M4486_10495 [Brachybacterium kimchii]
MPPSPHGPRQTDTSSAARSRRPSFRTVALIGTVILALVVALVVIPRLNGPRQRSADTRATSAPPDPASQRIAAGFDPSPGKFTLPDAETLTDDSISASLALDSGAARFGGGIGLSFEATELASPVWDSKESNIDEMLSALSKPVLRFGGNSVDRRVWWTSSDEPAPSWARATVTPEDLDRLAETLETTDSRVTLGVDLGHDDPDRAADMVAHARKAFGDRLLAVSVGNEPNGFFHKNQPQLAMRDSSWGTDDYQRELEDYDHAIQSNSPGTPMAGPGAYDAAWMRAFAQSQVNDKAALTMHWYPLWDCEGPASSIANPTLEDLTSPKLRAQARKIIGLGENVAHESDLPFWLEETGPTSCPGTNETSRTHAQALWTSDFTLTAAESGASQVAFHSTLQACKGGAPMSPLCAQGPKDDPGEIFQGRTSYLSLMQLGWIPEGKVLTPSASGDGRVMVHGVLADDGTLTLVIVDMRAPSSAAEPVPVRVSAPRSLSGDAPKTWHPAEGSTLSGNTLDADYSALGAPAPVGDKLAGLTLGRGTPLTLASAAGTTTVLTLTPDTE